MFANDTIIYALILTLLAGLSTGIGSVIAIFTVNKNRSFLSAALGFSAGVMVYISFMEMLPHAFEHLGGMNIYAIIFFFIGIIVGAIIDKLIPELNVASDNTNKKESNKIYRVGLFMAIAIAIHNFPEGIVTFMSTLSDPKLGVGIAFAVAIHNIPEGIAVSAPIFKATNSKTKAFSYSFLSGLAEPVGALLAYFILMPFLNDTVLGAAFAIVAGIMIFISFDELLPTAQQYGSSKLSVYGFILGLIIMALSIYLTGHSH